MKPMMTLAALIGLMMFSATACAVERLHEENGVLTLQGSGQVQAEPDEGYITVGVQTLGATSAVAVRENAGLMQNLYQTLAAFGVKKKEIQTIDFSVRQHYKEVSFRNDQGRTERRNVPDGFKVVNQVRVTVCDLKNMGRVLDALVESGANRIHNIVFGSSEANKLTDEARVKAVEDAKRKASLLLKPLGLELGKVKSISENNYGGHRQLAYAASSMRSMNDESPISGGTLTFSARVSIVWEICPCDK